MSFWYGLTPKEIESPNGFDLIESESDFLMAKKKDRLFYVCVEGEKITALIPKITEHGTYRADWDNQIKV